MCGRYSIYESMDHYLKQLSLDLVVINGYDDERIHRYNVAPRSRAPIIRPVDDGVQVDDLPWGWVPRWARDRGPVPINARAETLGNGRFFSRLWPGGRALAPASGWYEWSVAVHDARSKQPWYVKAAEGEPLFFAALAEAPGHDLADVREGFVIVTAPADGRLADIHGRKPVVLTAALAREWIDPATSLQRALEIVHSGGKPDTAFRWHAVGHAVGNVRNEGAHLIEPLQTRGKTQQQ
ncbi:SOS response-associated peptidase [Pseudomonas parafulva]|uniref:SOS response-associated peptidase n=1 Tax=Pseudomonas parafulva TaxID=157782 RepID=UPI00054095D7|nr:SOS response-associated peptidase family protein [Pseudomonas parafulva]AIZ33343.1 hypothetical protein NJ69_10280 [Pseudomonas parafulva]